MVQRLLNIGSVRIDHVDKRFLLTGNEKTGGTGTGHSFFSTGYKALIASLPACGYGRP